MKRRVALALFTALALLAAPTAATALARTDASDAHPAAGHAVEHRHATVAGVVGAARTGHDGRTPHPYGSSLAVLAGLVGTAAASTRAGLFAVSPSSAGELPSSSRPRAPPAVV